VTLNILYHYASEEICVELEGRSVFQQTSGTKSVASCISATQKISFVVEKRGGFEKGIQATKIFRLLCLVFIYSLPARSSIDGDP
jgi:hypothetical protein